MSVTHSVGDGGMGVSAAIQEHGRTQDDKDRADYGAEAT